MTYCQTRTVTITHEQIEDALIAYLSSIGAISDEEDVISLDLGIPLNEKGNVDIDVETVLDVD